MGDNGWIESKQVTLADLSHATLVEHATQLQKDYNEIGGKHQEEMDRYEETISDLKVSLHDVSVMLKDTQDENASLRAKLDRAFEDVEMHEKNAREQNRLKNKHIDLHQAASARANQADSDLKMVRESLEEVSGHLRDAVDEVDTLHIENQRLNVVLETVRQSNTRKNAQIEKLTSDLANHPANVKNKAALTELRYKTLQTTIRWGAFFASVFSIGYHLA